MSREQTRQNSFFGGAAILAAGIALVKVIGAIFKIPIVRILGEASYADFSNALLYLQHSAHRLHRGAVGGPFQNGSGQPRRRAGRPSS